MESGVNLVSGISGFERALTKLYPVREINRLEKNRCRYCMDFIIINEELVLIQKKRTNIKYGQLIQHIHKIFDFVLSWLVEPYTSSSHTSLFLLSLHGKLYWLRRLFVYFN